VKESVKDALTGELVVRTVNYGYDDLYRLSSETVLDAAGTVTRQVNYTYDDVGNRTVLSDSAAGTTAYQYDKNDRLLSETGATNATYTYDGNGNTKSVTQAGEVTTYTWDNRNRMTQVQSPTETTVYGYDDENIRTSSLAGGLTTQFLLDGNRDYSQVVAEARNGTVQASYVYGLDLVSQKRGGTESFYLVDGLGSTRGLTDATGGLTDSYTYDAFGNLLGSSGSTSNSYLFAGEQYDSNLDQYYLRQRFYDAGTGRFTRKDTYEGNTFSPITLNKYVYGNANPVSYTDPTGLFSYAGEALGGVTLGAFLVGGATVGYISNNYDPEPLGGFGAGGSPSVPNHTGHKPQDSVLSKLLRLRGFNDDKRLDVGPNHTGHSPDDSLRRLISYIFSINDEDLLHPDPQSLTKNVGTIADFLEIPIDDVRNAIHAAKTSKIVRAYQKKKNPDVAIDLETGEIHIEIEKGKYSADSIGNIEDFLN
jgi:RHS repeat-associated protein